MGGLGNVPITKASGAALFVFAGCFLGATADVALRFPGVGVAVVFPSYAILTVALWRARPRDWWVLLLASSAGNYLPHRNAGASVSFVAMTEGVNYLRAIVAAVGLRHYTDRSGRLDTLREMVAYLTFAVGVAPGVSAFAGAAVVQWHGSSAPYGLIWQEWALSNALTALTFLPLFALGLDLAASRPRSGAPARRLVEASVLYGGLLTSGAAVFLSSYETSSVYPARLYWPLPFLLWAAVRFGPQLTSAALLAVSALSICGALERRGPFASRSPLDDLLELQLFLLAVSVPLLLLASLFKQQERTATALRHAEDQRRRLEAQRSVEAALRAADRRKDEFIAMLSHELRNPLASIAVSLEIVRRASPPSGETTWANEALGRQVQHLTRLVDDLLDISRITHGKIRLSAAPTDLRAVVASAVDVTRPLIDSIGHRLVVDAEGGPMLVRGDAVRLTQVVANLLNNAAKYTQRGGYIRVSLRDEPDGFRLVVRDTGIGISAAALGKIFDPFTQLPDRRHPVAGGLGVGLTLVKRLVELHGGRVEAASDGEGQGSTFTVRLPRLPEGDPGAASPAAPLVRRASASRRVLIVDDNVDAAEGLRLVLRLQDHEVEVVHDGAQALEAVSRQDPDVVLLDISMPLIDGLEVARRVRERYGARRPLLVAVTGLGMPEDLRRSARAGFDHHLVKPIDFGSLQDLLSTATAARRG